MEKFNVIMVLNEEETHMLMCFRTKEPYKGMFNFPGGKIEFGEDHLASAYRELFEETGISKEDVTLSKYIDFIWHPVNMSMDVTFGVLNKEVTLVEELHPLHWISLEENFFDLKKFAGEGNIGHMVEIYKYFRRNNINIGDE